ncbi:MAG: hypothetical protein ONB16_04645 [candidate division KSB1 bacterium]|nr:hypothetical protein [candidate division KSB1 bacterium]MDZ7340805.1 hypothetical protein [candidate division KSB1 bacterium]
MRIGEVAIISHTLTEPETFIRSICGKIEVQNPTTCFGRFDVDDQLGLHLYGVRIDPESKSFFWDIASRKMLGYIFIFNWDDRTMLESIKPLVDHFAQQFEMPIVVVANIADRSVPPIPEKFFQPNGIALAANARFTFGQISAPADAKKVLVLLINMLLERLD